MAHTSGYRWDAPAGGPAFRHTATAWDLRWWILAAVATSIGIHAALFVWMKNYQLPVASREAVELRTGVFETELEQISIPMEILQQPQNLPPDLTQQVNQNPPVQELPDISQIAEAL